MIQNYFHPFDKIGSYSKQELLFLSNFINPLSKELHSFCFSKYPFQTHDFSSCSKCPYCNLCSDIIFLSCSIEMHLRIVEVLDSFSSEAHDD